MKKISKQAKPLMIQGTMSSSGKSLITAGLCRILHQNGHDVAPFKSQNMALNSYITLDGMEMGRAQVLQAQACGLEPDVSMNPILLKPTSDMGAQLIVHGEVRGQYSAVDYFKMKKQLIPEIMESFEKVKQDRDYIIIEGAGSPAEINLKQEDIVNMGMAKLAQSPVLLIGDIDRGGVFASLYGTLLLLSEEERKRVKGLIINKFRGDVEILKPGLKMLEDLTGIPVIGVIPMIAIDLDDEDSESDKLKKTNLPAADCLDIAVIKLPRLSNFTDFNVFGQVENVSLRYVDQLRKFGNPDLVIIPGSKNTLADLEWLNYTGLATAISGYAVAGNPVAGICGGYQMLGEVLHDPDNVEQGGTQQGLGLLAGKTVFCREKTRTRIKAKINPEANLFCNCELVCSENKAKNISEDVYDKGKTAKEKDVFEGYEIHMGVSEIIDRSKSCPLFILEDGREDGMISSSGLVWGTYLHGIFDNSKFLMNLLNWLWKRKNSAQNCDTSVFQSIDVAAIRERELNRLADTMRRSIDMQALYRIINEHSEIM